MVTKERLIEILHEMPIFTDYERRGIDIMSEEEIRTLASHAVALIEKPVIDPFSLPKVEAPTPEQIGLLVEWEEAAGIVWRSVRQLAWVDGPDLIWKKVEKKVFDAVGESTLRKTLDAVCAGRTEDARNLIGETVDDSVQRAIWAYALSFIDIPYEVDHR